MDLRRYNLSRSDVEEAKKLFAYQPVLLSESVCTGVGYNWLHAKDPETAWKDGPEVYDAATVGPEKFALALDANQKVLRTYETFVLTLCRLFPSGSYLDVSCNTGYFPVMASLNGMGECVGMDPLDFSKSVEFLNRVTGSHAKFIRGLYHPAPPALLRSTPDGDVPLGRRFDVVSNLEFLCHLADPLQFLHALAQVANKAIFLWSGFLDSEEYVIRLNPPLASYPAGFHDFFWGKLSSGSAMSTQLLFASMALLGFSEIVELHNPGDGLPRDWHEKNMRQYQRHRAFLCVREEHAAEVLARLNAGKQS